MKLSNEEFFKLLGRLDDDHIAGAGDKLARYYNGKKRKTFPLKTVVTAASAAAVVLVVGVVLLKTNVISVLPQNSGSVSLTTSDGVNIDLTKEKEFEITLDAAFAYDENGMLKRYEVGEPFGKNTMIKSAAATYLYSGRETRLKKQEVVLEYDINAIISDGNSGVIYAEDRYERFEFPSFGEGFTVVYDESSDKSPNEGAVIITQSEIKLTVDHDMKTITFNDGTNYAYQNDFEKGDTSNEDQ